MRDHPVQVYRDVQYPRTRCRGAIAKVLTVITFPDIGAVIPTLNQGICSTHLPLPSAEQAIAFGEHRGCLFRRHPYFFDPLIVFLYCFHQFSVAFLIKVTALHFIVGRVMRQQAHSTDGNRAP